MLLQWVTLVCAAQTARGTVQIIGEVSVDLRVANRDDDNDGKEIQKMLQKIKSGLQLTESLQSDSTEIRNIEARRDSDFGVSDVDDAKANDTNAIGTSGNNGTDTADVHDTKYITAVPMASCDYQYPEQQQTNAMLGNMMNQLTKMFVRLSVYMRRVNMQARAVADKRFTQIPTKHSNFFEYVYFNMSDEFQRACEAARASVLRLRYAEPCDFQRPLRAAWVAVLRAAQSSLSNAAKLMLQYHLGTQARTDPDPNATTRAVRRASKFLRRVLASVQSEQLVLLCEKFQLCYHELMALSKPIDDKLTSLSSGTLTTSFSITELTESSTMALASSMTPSSASTPKIPKSSTYVYSTSSQSSSPLPSQDKSPTPPSVLTTTSPVPPSTTLSESTQQ